MESEKNNLKTKSISRKKKMHNNSNDLEIDPKVTPINVSELEQTQRDQLISIAEEKAVDSAENLSKQELIYNILKKQSENNGAIIAGGVLTVVEDGFGFLRSNKLIPGPSDVYVSQSQIRKLGLRSGDYVVGLVRSPKDQEKYYGLLRVERVNNMTSEEAKRRPNFEDLTPIFPDDKIILETDRPEDSLSQRIVDIFSPVGKGQRALIVSPPKAGKTMLLKSIANGITSNNKDIHLMVLLIGERPEEVTDMKRSVQGEVIASTFDEPVEDHTRVTEVALERAKRLVEAGTDVVILMDSVTRLARAYNLAMPTSGRTLSGGMDPIALFPPKKFFGAARNTQEGGSLTIVATCLIETGSRMDDVIFEEFKGTGNMEVRLVRRLAEKRIYPAIDVLASSTRREDLLFSEEDLKSVWLLRRMAAMLEEDSGDATERVLERMSKTKNNSEFLLTLKDEKV
ncbi:MAG: transcription termination factor Rho [Chloroflexi bacterium]|nr:transcription termination factor Rho [Chloroflexota bacterium]|tara:strand:- start:19733 stop:21097 length:1365 start_codon:yes stop_codon:yes gene_type:complete